MRQNGRIKRAVDLGDRMRVASMGLRHQYRVRNILLTMVGIEVCAFFILRAWNAL